MIEKKFKKKKKEIHKFSTKTIAEIYRRDNMMCVYCGSRYGLTAHHVYYKPLERLRDGTQNNIDKGVTLCFAHHTGDHGVHNGNSDVDKTVRLYLLQLYYESNLDR